MLAGALLGALGWLVEGVIMEVSHFFVPQLQSSPQWEERGGLGVVAAGICGGLAGGLAAGIVAALLCVAAVAPDVPLDLVLHRLADGGALALVGVIIPGFAIGGRTGLRWPADWDWRLPATGFAAAICYGLSFDNACGTVSALIYGVTAAVVGRDDVGTDPACPVTRVRWHWSPRGVGRGLLGGLLLGGSILLEGLLADVLSGGSVQVYIAPAEPVAAGWAALQVGAVFAVACVLLNGLRTVPVDLGAGFEGRALLANDRRTLGTCVLTAVVLGALVIGTQGWCATLWGSTGVWGAATAESRPWAYAVGLVPSLLTGLAIGIRQSAWSRYAVARCYLALRAKVPFDLMAFVADAHEHRGVLRRTGAVHQFRHIELQHRLAESEP